MAAKGRRAFALLRRYRALFQFAHPFECRYTRGGDCTCGAQNAEREVAELLESRRSASSYRRRGVR